MLSIEPIPIYEDNYVWCLFHQGSAWVVDPGDHLPVIAMLEAQNLTLEGVLITHGHWDHITGLQALLDYKEVPVYASEKTAVSVRKQLVSDGDEIEVLGHRFRVIESPGHTIDHIMYYCDSFDPPALLCGDTLFSAGCGRLFNGTAEMLHRSIMRIAELPDHTKLYCTHEYTEANLKFAAAVEPMNGLIHLRARHAQALRDQNRATLPAVLSLEKQINPFLRVEEETVIASVEKFAKKPLKSPEQVFAALRSWKDVF